MSTFFIPHQDDFNGLHKDTEWIHLEGNTEGGDVGYYFPGKADIQGLRETREGKWTLVNTYEKFRDEEDRINSFATFWFDHGEEPENDTYAYVVLPGRTADETERYNAEPDIEILTQTDSIHAVREKKLGITGVNFFEPGTYGPFTVTQPQSVMMKENEDGTVDISFADPTQTQASLSLSVAMPIMEVVSMDEGITASDESGVMVFTTESDKNARAQAGRSWKVTVCLGGNDNMFETVEPGTVPEHWTADNGKAEVAAEDNGNHVLEMTADQQDAMTAVTELVYPEEGGAAVQFQLKPLEGSGKVYLGNGESRIQVLSFGGSDSKLEQGIWHNVKIKVNPDTGSLQVMVDGKLYGEKVNFEGSLNQALNIFTAELESGAKAQLDNLIVRQAVVTPPAVPKNLTYTAYGDTFVDLMWDPVESENPVYYILSVDGKELETQLKENTYRLEGLTPGEAYEIMVCSVDDEDNYSEWSSALEVALLEELQVTRYVIDFDEYEAGTVSQHGWAYAGKDSKGKIEILNAPEGEKSNAAEGLMTDLEYQAYLTATPANAEEELATDSNAKKATGSNAKKATSSNADQALYVYSGTAASGTDKNVAYKFDPQTKKQTYELDVYLDKSAPYTNFCLTGSDGIQAVTMMISDYGIIGYRAGDAPSKTVELLDEKVEGQWIHFVVTADPETQTFSISANGVTAENLKFRNQTKDIAALKINAPGNGTGGIYADNIILPADEDFGKWTVKGLDEELPEELEAVYGTAFEDLELPQYVNVLAVSPEGEEESVEVRVNWNSKDYDPEKTGSQIIHGTLALPSNYINKMEILKIRVVVEEEIPVYQVILVQTTGGMIESDLEEAEEGTTVTLTAEPEEGYKLAYWLINGAEKGAGEEIYCVELTEDIVVSAVFEAEDVKPEVNYYRVDVPSQVTGGQIRVNSVYAKEGTEIVVTAIPNAGYRLTYLKVDGRTVQVDTENQYSFILTRNTRISVSFKKIKDSDSSHNGGSGTGSFGGDVTAPEAAYAVRGTWNLADGKWQFKLEDGSMAANRWACILHNGAYYWYYFDAEGNMVTGWQTINGQTFYLLPSADSTCGRMVTGWQQIDGKWYWFNPASDGNKGVLLKNETTPDGYKVGADGVWIP